MTDKIKSGLIKYYEELFKELKNEPVKMLELGILKGESLMYFKEYFQKGEIIGVDHKLPEIQGVKMIQGWQNDVAFLQRLGNENAPFDIILDDCSHYGDFTQISFDFLFKHLKEGGYYIIEDWCACFNHAEYRGMDEVACNVIRNFDRLKIKSVNAIKLPEGGSLVVINK